MNSYIRADKLTISSSCKSNLKILCNHYMRHEFNLLGSGWVKVGYFMQAAGVHGRRYRSMAMNNYGRRIKQELRNSHAGMQDYEPINWYADYKSGFFFDPRKYGSPETCNTVTGNKPGVDIKCPWELGRFYHLVRLAVYAIGEETVRPDIIREFRNEVIDFADNNPVGKTVQWSCAMDSAIRIVNMLCAYDLLEQVDLQGCFDTTFKLFFEEFIYNSLRYVMNNLEYIGRYSTNHYLSDIAGVIFAAAYLPSDSFTDACLAFGVQELIAQVRSQFHEEGSNYEGSASYHRLSSEIALYSSALIYGVLKTDRREAFSEYDDSLIERLNRQGRQSYNIGAEEFFPQWYLDRMYNMGLFTRAVMKDNNEIVQVGDNDNGRLLKLTPAITPLTMQTETEENVLDHRTLLSAWSGLFGWNEESFPEEDVLLERSLIRALSKEKRAVGKRFTTRIGQCGRYDGCEYPYSRRTLLYSDGDKAAGSLLEGMTMQYYKEFGIIILRGRRLFLSMVLDTAKNARFPGHTHNDKLSIEATVDNQYITRDPGSYVYTALPEIRDSFRSVRAHNTIHVEGCEQNLFAGTFGMKKRARAELLAAGGGMVVGKACYGAVEHIREIEIKDDSIVVKDYSNYPFTVGFRNKLYSVGYGRIVKESQGGKKNDCKQV